jgi:hypothetical protein
MQQRLKQSPVSGCLVQGVMTDELLVIALLPLVAKYISRSMRRKIVRRLRNDNLSYADAVILIEYHLDVVASHHGFWFAHHPDREYEIGFYEDTLFD